jgi:acetyl esterase/lipase
VKIWRLIGSLVGSSLAVLIFTGFQSLPRSKISSGNPLPINADSTPYSCANATFERNFRYGPDEPNVLDIVRKEGFDSSQRRPVLLFVVGESFTESAGPAAYGALLDQAMCLAASNDLVAVRMSYRLAPNHHWPAAAQDVAAAISWIKENIDLFGGDRNEVIAVGYSVGAFHVASSLAHPELRVRNSVLAGVVLVSGLYRIGTHSSAAVKAYIGDDPAKYKERSIFPGILFTESPILLAWSDKDVGHVVTESEELKSLICEARRGACPQHALLPSGGSIASILEVLGEPMKSLISQIEARGLP